MKTRLISFALALLFAAGLMTCAAVTLHDSRDDLEVRETVLSGSRDAASGLSAEFFLRAGELNWDAAIELGADTLEPSAQFTRGGDSEGEIAAHMRRPQVRVALEDMGESVFAFYPVSEFMLEMDSEEFRPVRDVLSRTSPGQCRAESLPLSDYRDTLAWRFEESVDYYATHYDNLPAADKAAFDKLFPVPVLPEYYLRVTVARDSEGGVAMYDISPASGYEEPTVLSYPSETGTSPSTSVDEPWDIDYSPSVGVTSEAGLWIYPYAKDSQGRCLVGYPSGQGIYFLPRLTSGNDALALSHEPHAVLVPRAKLFYETTEEPVSMRLSETGDRIELITTDGGDLRFTLLDASTGAELSAVTIPWSGGSPTIVTDGDLTLLLDPEGPFALLSGESGAAKILLSGEIDAWWSVTGRRELEAASIAWDGERLAISDPGRGLVAVVDDEGIKYLASFDMSPMWNGRPQDVENILYDPYRVSAYLDPSHSQPLKIWWE